jgi:hypothetical protein
LFLNLSEHQFFAYHLSEKDQFRQN